MNKIYLAAGVSLASFIILSIAYITYDSVVSNGSYELEEPLAIGPRGEEIAIFCAEDLYLNNGVCESYPAFNTLTCDEIVNQNQLGIIYRTNDTTFSQERIIECLKEHRVSLELQDYKGSQLECMDNDDVWMNEQCYPGPNPTILDNGCVSNTSIDGTYSVSCGHSTNKAIHIREN